MSIRTRRSAVLVICILALVFSVAACGDDSSSDDADPGEGEGEEGEGEEGEGEEGEGEEGEGEEGEGEVGEGEEGEGEEGEGEEGEGEEGEGEEGEGEGEGDPAWAQLPWPEGKYIPVADVHALIEAGHPDLLPLNVVDAQFYDLGHLPDSQIIPWDQLPGRLDEVPRDKRIIVYCRRGVRSEAGYATLEGAGYAQLWVMEGGIEAWIGAGYPVVHGE